MLKQSMNDAIITGVEYYSGGGAAEAESRAAILFSNVIDEDSCSTLFCCFGSFNV